MPPGNYERVDNLMRKVIDPAVLQVNGLSDMSVAIEQRRRHSRAPVHEFALTWWKKQGEEFQVAMRERNRSKVGRMARLRGEVDKVEAFEREQASGRSELAETAQMRAAGCRRAGKLALQVCTPDLFTSEAVQVSGLRPLPCPAFSGMLWRPDAWRRSRGWLRGASPAAACADHPELLERDDGVVVGIVIAADMQLGLAARLGGACGGLACRSGQQLAPGFAGRSSRAVVSNDRLAMGYGLLFLHLCRCAHLQLFKNPLLQGCNLAGGLAVGLRLAHPFTHRPGGAVGAALAQDDRCNDKPVASTMARASSSSVVAPGGAALNTT